MKTSIKKVILNTTSFRYEISPLDETHSLRLDKALQRIMQSTTTTWRQLATFLNLKNQSEAFKAVYGSASSKTVELRTKIRELYVVDTDADTAYLYRYDKKPAQVPAEYISPVLNNSEPDVQKATQFIPMHFASRSSISANKNILLMTLTPTSGYIYDPLSDKQTTIGNPVSFIGSHVELTNILRRVLFIGTEIGTGGVTISINDQQGNAKSITSDDITLDIAENTEVVDVKINLPESSKLTLNEYTKVTGLSVSEKNDRVLTVKVTPFNCSMTVPNQLEAIPNRGVLTLNGTPDFVNSRLSQISVLATDKTAQLGILTVCGSTKVLKYHKFEYAEVEQTEEVVDTPVEEKTTTPEAVVVEEMAPVTLRAKSEQTATVEPEDDMIDEVVEDEIVDEDEVVETTPATKE